MPMILQRSGSFMPVHAYMLQTYKQMISTNCHAAVYMHFSMHILPRLCSQQMPRLNQNES